VLVIVEGRGRGENVDVKQRVRDCAEHSLAGTHSIVVGIRHPRIGKGAIASE
jgi:hypothetical protein